MTQEEKNKIELIAKEFALICVDEIVSELRSVEYNYDLESRHPEVCLNKTVIPYWQSVKQEINNL